MIDAITKCSPAECSKSWTKGILEDTKIINGSRLCWTSTPDKFGLVEKYSKLIVDSRFATELVRRPFSGEGSWLLDLAMGTIHRKHENQAIICLFQRSNLYNKNSMSEGLASEENCCSCFGSRARLTRLGKRDASFST